MDIIELIGYFGSFLVIVSMLMTSVVRLRIINAIGSSIFTGYALIIHSYPTAAMNFCLVLINLFNLYKLLSNKVAYSVVEVSADDSFLRHLLSACEQDIKKFFPEFSRNVEFSRAFIVCNESSPVGILLGTAEGDSLRVKLDYALPKFRDCSVGKYLYAYLASAGIRHLRVADASSKHAPYLRAMGFIPDGTDFAKEL
jgi:hypothetical protein